MSIDAFKTAISSGLARPNRYSVSISFPLTFNFSWDRIVKAGIMYNNGAITTMCESVDFPGIHIATVEDKLWGPIRKIPYTPIYNDINMIFMCDTKMTLRYLFDQWQDIVISRNKKQYYYDDYVGKMTIVHLNEQNKPTYMINCYEVYPQEVVPQVLSYGEVDTYLKLNVKMVYRYWDFTDKMSTLKSFFDGDTGLTRPGASDEEIPV